MSQENVESFRAYHDELARASQEGSDPEAMAEAMVSKMTEFWDPEVEYDMSESPVLDMVGVFRGTAACRRFWREWFSSWETLQFEYELVDGGDRVVVLLDLRMRGRSTGIEVAVGKHAFVTTFRDGLIFHNKLYMSQSEALDTVGLRE